MSATAAARLCGRRPDRQRRTSRRIVGSERSPPTSAGRSSTGVAHTQIRTSAATFGWTQGIDYFCNCADELVRLAAGALHQALLGRRVSANADYTLQRAEEEDGDYFFFDSSLNKGRDRLESHAHLRLPGRGRCCPSAGTRSTWRTFRRRSTTVIGGWQFNTNATISSGLPFRRRLSRFGRRPRHRRPGRVNLIGDPSGPQTQDQWFNVAPIGASGSAFSRPAAGTFGDMERNSLRGPGYWRVDASLFKHFPIGGTSRSRSASRRSTCSTTSTWATPIRRWACRATTIPTRDASPEPLLAICSGTCSLR